MATMGRRRKTDDGLQPRVYFNHGKYFYVHRDGTWEPLGADKKAANAKGRLYNDPDGHYGTLVYWLDMFIADCERRVALKSTIKGIKLAPRTLQDYRDAVGTDEKPGPLRVYFARPMQPTDVSGQVVQQFLQDCAEAERGTRGNRDRAALSSCFGWLLREHADEIPGLVVNPCHRLSGVQRNPEKKRERYVTHDEFNEVYAVASRAERVLMELTYRTCQRPESDIILWDTSIVTSVSLKRFLDFVQNKTGTRMRIAFSERMEELVPAPVGNIRKLREPLVKRLDGGFYTYNGISGMLRESIKVANERRRARGKPEMKSFGFRDLKGKGATDMYYLGNVALRDIQQLLGHKNQITTEIYIKQRWREAAAPNMVVMA